MAPSPGRPPDDRRRRHEKLPVTAPSHKPTSGYDIPACQISENLTRPAALERQLDPDIDNCRVRLGQMVKQLVEDSPVATQRVTQIVPAERLKSQRDQGLLFRESMVQIIEEDSKKTQVMDAELVRLINKLSEPSIQIFPPAATTPSNVSGSILERPEPAIGDQLDRPENPASSFLSRHERSVPGDSFDVQLMGPATNNFRVSETKTNETISARDHLSTISAQKVQVPQNSEMQDIANHLYAMFPPVAKDDPSNHPRYRYPPGEWEKNTDEDKEKTREETLSPRKETILKPKY